MVATVLVTLSTVSAAALGASASGGACASAMDCALNGDCVGGVCACDAAWSGSPSCDVLSFEKLDKAHMPGYYNKTESSWGGFPIEDGAGGFALVHAQMANSCGLGTWTSNSIVGLSRSTTGAIEGPYAFDKPILPHFAHNPTIRRAKDGTYVIFFIGGWGTNATDCRKDDTAAAEVSPAYSFAGEAAAAASCDGRNWPKSCGANMPGPSGDCCGPATENNGNTGCGIAMASSKSLDGPWTVVPLTIADQFDSDEVYCAHTNPSPVFNEDGSVTLAFNAGFCRADHLETIGVAHAPSWEGPYTLLAKNAVLRNPDGSPHHCEDPYLWADERGWHLLTHNQQDPQGEASYGYSLDAKTWTLSPTTPYDCTVHFTDGTSAEASGCGNRPQLVFSETPAAGGKPLWLINGAQAAKPQAGAGTWTLFRKVSASKQQDATVAV